MKHMKKIYITESQVEKLSNKKDEVTFYEFVISVKQFLKDLIKKPLDAQPSELLLNKGITKDELLKKMGDIGMVKKKERIDEVPIDETKHPYGKKLVSKLYVTYQIPKARFKEKLHVLYDDLFKLNEEGEGVGGATSCGSAMQGGGSNPSAGQYDLPFKPIQRRNIWSKSVMNKKNVKNDK